MCGIFGVISTESKFSPDRIHKLVSKFFDFSSLRGNEASGIACSTGNEILYLKKNMPATTFSQSLELKQFLQSLTSSMQKKDHLNHFFSCIGHSRLATNGDRSNTNNNQPIVTSDIVGVHNGIIINDSEIWKELDNVQKESQVDSEVIFKFIEFYLKESKNIKECLSKLYKKIKGVANIAFYHSSLKDIYLATNNGSLYITRIEEYGLSIFASEKITLLEIIKHIKVKNIDSVNILKLEPGFAASIDIEKGIIKTWALENADSTLQDYKTKKKILSLVKGKDYYKRCTKCILPDTFPFISFDNEGVCNVCRNFKNVDPKGLDSLHAYIEPFRSKNTERDCIVALSGGRDSCYGLHFIKKELGLNPIAYTYDWGMVTTDARRNQSLICAKLGIEHIIRSPNLTTKRKYIQKNIAAWLKKPDLGIIPLFMAGDKQFYYYGRQLRKETGIQLVFFCAGNPLERTEFKSGFCGVKESENRQVLYKYSIKNKLQLAFYYLKAYLTNTDYFNASFFDTLFAYYSTYIEKDDFLYLYHYIPWDENKINKTLSVEYGWQNNSDTSNTWRIGDGTAAFYNYIYYTLVGFSEYDTFRSNQVRYNIITRDEALALAEQDNQPRWQSMNEYAQLVGFNLQEAVENIYRAKEKMNDGVS
jgi:glucosamine--fructose-6-phosphate aminotransferase (isomerizing)